MLPQARAKSLWLLAPLLVLILCAPALAQNSLRAPAQVQVPMRMEAESPPAAKKAVGAADKAPATVKYPNKDTAKNRQDYEMGTDSGADGITLGRDESTGDSVMRYTPPKKKQQAPADPPIEVKVLVPGGKYTGAGS